MCSFVCNLLLNIAICSLVVCALTYSVKLSLKYQLLIIVPSFDFVLCLYFSVEFKYPLPNVLDSSISILPTLLPSTGEHSSL